MNVFVGIPTHDGRVETGTFKSVESDRHSLIVMANESSLLAYNCNQLLCMALNLRVKHKIKWFALLHSDVVPEMNWVDKLIDIAEGHKADLLSAIVPIKTEEGYVSTAIDKPRHDGFPKLYSNQIKNSGLPETFGITDVIRFLPDCAQIGDSLLVNTGCMVYNLDRYDEPFRHAYPCFSMIDKIMWSNGEYVSRVIPEDWSFSQQINSISGKVMATSAIKLHHVGKKRYAL